MLSTGSEQQGQSIRVRTVFLTLTKILDLLVFVHQVCKNSSSDKLVDCLDFEDDQTRKLCQMFEDNISLYCWKTFETDNINFFLISGNAFLGAVINCRFSHSVPFHAKCSFATKSYLLHHLSTFYAAYCATQIISPI